MSASSSRGRGGNVNLKMKKAAPQAMKMARMSSPVLQQKSHAQMPQK